MFVPRARDELGRLLERTRSVVQSGQGGRAHRLAQPRDLPEDLLDGEAHIGSPARCEVRKQLDDGCTERDGVVLHGLHERSTGEDLCQRRDAKAGVRAHPNCTTSSDTSYLGCGKSC